MAAVLGKGNGIPRGRRENVRREFKNHGLSDAAFDFVGAVKLASAAGLLAALMPRAIAMHRKVRSPILKSVPAWAMLAMTATLAVMESA